MNRKSSLLIASALLALVLVVIGSVVLLGETTRTQTVIQSGVSSGLTFIQLRDPEVAVLPATLGRLNWGAVIAGSLVALIAQLAFNLLGVGLGATTINPKYGEDSASPQALGTGAVIWIAVSTLLALFIGGWLAARFAGNPNRVDGMLHGIVTWAVVTLASTFLLTTAIGRILSGTTTLISQGLNMAGGAIGSVARGVGGAVSSVAGSVGNAAGSAIQGAANTAQNAAEDAIESRPEVADALRNRDATLQKIIDEGKKMLTQAGVDPNRVQGEAQSAVGEVQQAVKNVAQNPGDAEKIFTETISGLLNRAQGVTADVSKNVNRDEALNMLAERTGVSREQAEQTLKKWEDQFGQVRNQTEQTIQQARTQAEQLKRDAERKANELKAQADTMARDVADKTAKAVAGVALAAFAAIVIGAFAAGLGGAIGAPEELPTAQIDTNNNNSTNNNNVTPVNPTPLPNVTGTPRTAF